MNNYVDGHVARMGRG